MVTTYSIIPTPNSVVAGNRNSRKYGDKSFPVDGGTHGLYMEFKEYKQSKGKFAGVNSKGSIALPLPANISDNLQLDIGPSQLGIFGGLAADIAGGLKSGDLSKALEDAMSGIKGAGERAAEAAMGGTISDIVSNVTDYTNYMLRAAGGALGNQIEGGVSVATGTAVNPHTALLFNGVNLKNFSFTWNLSPRNEDEMNSISDIISTLKINSLPSYKGISGAGGSLSRGLLTYPNVVFMYFVGLDPRHYFKFKPMMITNVAVDYSPNGNVLNRGSKGSAPAFVNLVLQFTEMSIWTAEDMGKVSSSFGGGR
jgi:hypothetical protein